MMLISTTIIGNAIGTYSKSPNWIALTFLIILAIIGIFLFFKKPKARIITKIKPPRVIRVDKSS